MLGKSEIKFSGTLDQRSFSELQAPQQFIFFHNIFARPYKIRIWKQKFVLSFLRKPLLFKQETLRVGIIAMICATLASL